MGNRKIYVGESMKAKDAWKRLSEHFITGQCRKVQMTGIIVPTFKW